MRRPAELIRSWTCAGGVALSVRAVPGGCGGPNRYLATIYPNLVTSQMRQVFSRNAKADSWRFKIQARVWLEPSGQGQRAELAGTAGDEARDQHVAALLDKLDVEVVIPDARNPSRCGTQPWTGHWVIRGRGAFAEERVIILLSHESAVENPFRTQLPIR